MATLSEFVPANRAKDTPHGSPSENDQGDRSLQSPAWIAAVQEPAGFHGMAPWTNPQNAAGTITSRPGMVSKEDHIERAYARGMEAGRMAARQENAEHARATESLAANLKALDNAAANALCEHLEKAVIALCSQIIEPHMIDQEMLETRCKTLTASVQSNLASCILHMHPEDAALLSESFTGEWHVNCEDHIPRGTLMLEGPSQMLCDGPEQWKRTFAKAFQEQKT